MDFHRAFEAEVLVDADVVKVVERIGAGKVPISSGTIAVTDPLTLSRPEPLSRTVTPGDYEVEVLRVGADVGLARLVFASGAPARWELATWPGEDTRALRPGQTYAVAVDTATAAFADGKALRGALEGETQSNALLGDLKTATDGIVRFPGNRPVLVTFTTGGSDGMYSVWWGLDKDGAPLQLVFDVGAGDFERPKLQSDPEFRAAEARRHLDAVVAGAGRGEGVGEVFQHAVELGHLAEDSDELVDDLLAALRRYQADVAATNALIYIARRFAAVPRFQRRIALWLGKAPRDVANTFVLLLRPRVLETLLAVEVAQVLGSAPDRNKRQLIDEIDGLKSDRQPFIPVLGKLAKDHDAEIAKAANRVLKRWKTAPPE